MVISVCRCSYLHQVFKTPSIADLLHKIDVRFILERYVRSVGCGIGVTDFVEVIQSDGVGE